MLCSNLPLFHTRNWASWQTLENLDTQTSDTHLCKMNSRFFCVCLPSPPPNPLFLQRKMVNFLRKHWRTIFHQDCGQVTATNKNQSRGNCRSGSRDPRESRHLSIASWVFWGRGVAPPSTNQAASSPWIMIGFFSEQNASCRRHS